MEMKNLAIIPARGGSKRIPRKNIKLFMGKPILAYSIEAALASNLFDEVIVSTDDENIADIARQYGAKVPFMRTPQTSNDYATLSEVVQEVIENYMQLGYSFDNFCCVLSTAPFIKSEDLVNAYEVLLNSTFDTIRPVVKFSYPIQRAFQLNESGRVDWFFPEYKDCRSQDLVAAYHDAGLFYWGKVAAGLDSPNRGAIIIEESKCQDIDTVDDWFIAEQKYRILNYESKNNHLC